MAKDESHARGFQGAVERSLGRIQPSVEHCAQAVQIARGTGDPWAIAYSLLLAYATIGGKWTGQPPIAELNEALDLFRSAGDSWGIAHTQDGLADLYRELGHLNEARMCYEETLAGFQKLKDRWMVAWARAGLGSVFAMSEDLAEATSCYREALDLFDSLGDETNAVITLGRLGMLARRQADHARAACLLAGFEGLRQGLVGSLGPRQFDRETESAVEAYRADFVREWPAWRAMSLHQAVAKAFEPEPRPTWPERSG
jgi:tetratricopeptide (TPR) repeat protein